MKPTALAMAALGLTSLVSVAFAQIEKPADEQFGNPIPPPPERKVLKQDWGGLKPGLGREETFYACVTCHTEGRITRSRMTREDWAITLDSLTEHNEVPPLEDDELALILDYLGEHYGPEIPHP
ncbi:MAG: hypothetical protein ACE363_13275 [Alphaproteobacteria bacterium]